MKRLFHLFCFTQQVPAKLVLNNEIDLVSGIKDTEKSLKMDTSTTNVRGSSSHPLGFASSNPADTPRRLSVPPPITSASGYLIFQGGANPPTPIQPRPTSQNSFVAQQQLTQIDGVRQQVSKEVESLRSKLEQSENGRNNLVQELAQIRNTLDRLEQDKRSQQQQQQYHTQTVHSHVEATSRNDQSSELVQRLFNELESVKQQLASSGQQSSNSSQSMVQRITLLELEKKRLENTVKNMTAQMEVQQLQQQNIPRSQTPVVVSQQSTNVSESMVVSELRRVAQSLSNELNDCRSRLKEANAQILGVSEIKARQPMVEAELLRLRTENESSRNQLVELKKIVQSSNDRVFKLNEELERTGREKKDIEQLSHEKDESLGKLRQEIQELTQQVNTLKSQNDRLSIELEFKNERISDLDKARETFQLQQKTAMQVNAEHHQQFFEEVELLKKENNELKTRLAKFENESDFNLRVQSELKQKQNEILHQRSILEQQKQNLEEENQRLDDLNRMLTNKLSQMNIERDMSDNELETVRQERIRLLDEVSQLRIALEQTEKKRVECYEHEMDELKSELLTSKTAFRCNQEELKTMVHQLSNEADQVIDRTVFVLSIVSPQLEHSMSFQMDSPPLPLNLNKMQDFYSLSRFLQNKISWISRQLDKLCSMLDKAPLAQLMQTQHSINQPVATDDDIISSARKSIQVSSFFSLFFSLWPLSKNDIFA